MGERFRYEGPERRNGGTADWLAGLPVWVRAITIIGTSSSIALFLVWMGANYLPKIGSKVDLVDIKLQRVLDAQTAHEAQTEYTVRLLQRICSNTAKTDFERQRCFDR